MKKTVEKIMFNSLLASVAYTDNIAKYRRPAKNENKNTFTERRHSARTSFFQLNLIISFQKFVFFLRSTAMANEQASPLRLVADAHRVAKWKLLVSINGNWYQ